MALIPIKTLTPGAMNARKAGVPLATDFPGIVTGATVNDIVGGKLYINTGTPAAPVFSVVGSQN